MKLQRNNKYKNKIALGLSTLMLASMLTGCAKNIEFPIDLPQQTEEIVETMDPVTTELPIETPDVTPIVTPEPTPEVTEEPRELTEEEKFELEVEKLCVVDDGVKINGLYMCAIIFQKDGQGKVIPVQITSDETTITFLDLFRGEELISIDVSLWKTPDQLEDLNYFIRDLKEFEGISPYFEDVEEVNIATQWYDFYRQSREGHTLYDNQGMEKFSPEELMDLMQEITYNQLSYDPNSGFPMYISYEFDYTRDFLARIYVKYTTEDYRVTAYDLNPELKNEDSKTR